MKLIPSWRRQIRRLWSIRLGLLFGAINGAILGLAAFSDVINPWLFLSLNVVGYGVIVGARLLKQPGAEV